MAAAVPHFVDIVGGHVQVAEIEHDVVAGVLSVLHGAEDAVSRPWSMTSKAWKWVWRS